MFDYRKAIRRYCRRSIIIVFYRWKYESRWLSLKKSSTMQVILQLRKNLMTMRLLYLNWLTLVKKKLRLNSAIIIQQNFRYHLRHRRTRARLTITKFLVRKYSYYLWCKRIIEERRRMDFEARAAHSFMHVAEVRLDRYIYQDFGGMKVTADYLRACKERINEESSIGLFGSSFFGLTSSKSNSNSPQKASTAGNISATSATSATSNASRVIPSASQLPRIDEQWTIEGKLLYVVQYKCAMQAADLGRRTYREEDPPPYWFVFIIISNYQNNFLCLSMVVLMI